MSPSTRAAWEGGNSAVGSWVTSTSPRTQALDPTRISLKEAGAVVASVARASPLVAIQAVAASRRVAVLAEVEVARASVVLTSVVDVQ